MKRLIFFGVWIFLVLGVVPLAAQEKKGKVYLPGTRVVVVLTDGSQVSGKIVLQDAEGIVLETESMGKVTITSAKIRSVTEVSKENVTKKGKVWFENPNPYKYLLGYSAIPKPKKMATYQNVWVFFNSFSYAPLDFLDISAGFELFSLLSKDKNAPYVFYVNPKVSTKVFHNFYAGGNVLYVNYFNHSGDDSATFTGLGVLNAFATYGTSNLNITGGLGWGFVNGDFEGKPVISIGGMARVSRRIAFVTENWFIPEIGEDGTYYGMYSYGIRFLGQKNAIDLAFINSKDIAKEIFLGIPFLDFVINF